MVSASGIDYPIDAAKFGTDRLPGFFKRCRIKYISVQHLCATRATLYAFLYANSPGWTVVQDDDIGPDGCQGTTDLAAKDAATAGYDIGTTANIKLLGKEFSIHRDLAAGLSLPCGRRNRSSFLLNWQSSVIEPGRMHCLALLEGLPIGLIELVIRQVGIQAGSADIAVAGQRLGDLEIS